MICYISLYTRSSVFVPKVINYFYFHIFVFSSFVFSTFNSRVSVCVYMSRHTYSIFEILHLMNHPQRTQGNNNTSNKSSFSNNTITAINKIINSRSFNNFNALIRNHFDRKSWRHRTGTI